MSIEGNKEVIRKGWESYAKGDLDGIATMYHDDVVFHGAADEEIQGRDALIAWDNDYLMAFPDIEAHVEDQIAEGDRVFSRVRTVGTNTGPLMGKAPTGNRVELRLMTVHRFRDGRVAEEWAVFDRLDMMTQLGHVPAQA